MVRNGRFSVLASRSGFEHVTDEMSSAELRRIPKVEQSEVRRVERSGYEQRRVEKRWAEGLIRGDKI